MHVWECKGLFRALIRTTTTVALAKLTELRFFFLAEFGSRKKSTGISRLMLHFSLANVTRKEGVNTQSYKTVAVWG